MEQGLSTSLTMTQRLDTSLLQLIDIITMSTEELNEKIKKEAEINPVLEIKNTEKNFNSERINAFRRSYSLDEANSRAYSDDEKEMWFEKTVSEKEDLKEHLSKELGLVDMSPSIRETAETLISALDESGFTGPDPESLVPEWEKEYVADAIKIIQSLEPTGVGARDWKESLMIQIKEKEKNKEEVRRYHDIIYKGLGYIQNGEEDKLARAMKIGREDLDAMIAVIKSLTPFPGLKYTATYDPYIAPEITVTVKNGAILLDMHSSDLIDVGLDESYLALKDEIKNKSDKKDREANKFLRKNILDAENLINQIKMRKSTMEKLGLLLVEKQKDFFLYGPMYLKALTMTKAAEVMNVNVSTVSKLANEKYVLTDWGTYPLRFFFSSEVKSSDNDDISKTAVIYKIKEILSSLPKGKKISDQKISDMLAEEGLSVARRTVNKYRKEIAK